MGRRTFGRFLIVLVALAASAAFAGVAVAQTQTFVSTAPQSGFEDFITPEVFPLTSAPYTFGNEVQGCETIERITVTLTLIDGDTGGGPNDTNRDNLSLGLDSIDTGILLNGFPEGGAPVTRTITGIPQNEERILEALKQDNRLEGRIFDRTAFDDFVGVPAAFDTTLEFTCATADLEQGVPAPIVQEDDVEAESGDIVQTVQVGE